MAKGNAPSKPAKSGQTRQDRLKAALKANMGRRKAQARARSVQNDDSAPHVQDATGNAGEDPQTEGE